MGENVVAKSEMQKKLEEFMSHDRSVTTTDMLRDTTGGLVHPTGRLVANTALTDEVKRAARALGTDLDKCTMKYHSNVNTKEIIGKIYAAEVTGAMLINQMSDGSVTLHFQNVFDDEPRLRVARKQWVPVSVVTEGADTYFIIKLAGARIRNRRRSSKSESQPQPQTQTQTQEKPASA